MKNTAILTIIIISLLLLYSCNDKETIRERGYLIFHGNYSDCTSGIYFIPVNIGIEELSNPHTKPAIKFLLADSLFISWIKKNAAPYKNYVKFANYNGKKQMENIIWAIPTYLEFKIQKERQRDRSIHFQSMEDRGLKIEFYFYNEDVQVLKYKLIE